MNNDPVSSALTPVTPTLPPPAELPAQETLAVVHTGNVVQAITLAPSTSASHAFSAGITPAEPASAASTLANAPQLPAFQVSVSDLVASGAASASASGSQSPLLAASFQTINLLPGETPAAQQRARRHPQSPTYCRSAASVARQAPAQKVAPAPRYTDPLDLLRASVINNPDKDAMKLALKNKMTALDNLLKQRPAGERIELADFDLRQLDFSQLKAPLNKISFVNCRFDDASMANILMEHCQLTACEAGNSDWRNAVLHHCTFSSTQMHCARLHATQLIACQLTKTGLQGMEAHNVVLSGTTLTHCKMQRARLEQCDLSGITVEHCNLTDATVAHSDMNGATLRNCKLVNATLADNIWLETTTEQNVFNGATLTGAFHGASFTDNAMYAVHIAGADFRGVMLAASCTLALPPVSEKQGYFASSDPLCVKLMHAIHSSEESDLPIKTKLMRQLVQHLDLQDVTLSREMATTLLKTLAMQPYRHDRDINAFVIKLMPFVESDNAQPAMSEEVRKARAEALSSLRSPVSHKTRLQQEHGNYNKKRTLMGFLQQPRNGKTLELLGLDLQGMHFTGLIFKNVDLRWANICNSEFTGCVFADCNLSGVQMESCRFKDCYLSDNVTITAANLRKTVFQNCDLTRIEASRTDFTNAWLHACNVNHANLACSNMSGFMMRGGEINDTDFSGSQILEATFEGCQMNDTLMDETILHGTTFIRVIMHHADLSTAALADLRLVSAELDDARLNNSLTLDLPEWDDLQLTEYFIHFPQSGYSLLKTLQSIPKAHLELKLALAEQLVTSLSAANIDLTAVSEPLIEVLGRPFWRQSALIREFNYQVIDLFLAHHAPHLLAEHGVNFLSIIVGNLHDNLPLAYRHQIAFAQLINQVVYSDVPADLFPQAIRQVNQALAREIYDKYLQQPAVQKALQERNIADVYRERQAEADWSDRQSEIFLLFSREQHTDAEAEAGAETPASGPTMVLSGESLARMLHPTIPANWGNFWLLENGAVLTHGEYDTARMLERCFPAFYACWQSQQKSSLLEQLVASINLSDDLYQLFMDAAGQSFSTRKLTDPDSLEALKGVFLPLLEPVTEGSRECKLSTSHYQQILQLYQLEDASDREQAEMLFSISIVFVRYASANIFGKPDDSPDILRLYCLACMAEAQRLCPELFIVHIPYTDAVEAEPGIAARPAVEAHDEDLFPDWRERLLGITKRILEEEDVHCANTLATEMLGLADSVCNGTVNSIYPQTWS